MVPNGHPQPSKGAKPRSDVAYWPVAATDRAPARRCTSAHCAHTHASASDRRCSRRAPHRRVPPRPVLHRLACECRPQIGVAAHHLPRHLRAAEQGQIRVGAPRRFLQWRRPLRPDRPPRPRLPSSSRPPPCSARRSSRPMSRTSPTARSSRSTASPWRTGTSARHWRRFRLPRRLRRRRATFRSCILRRVPRRAFPRLRRLGLQRLRCPTISSATPSCATTPDSIFPPFKRCGLTSSTMA